MAWTGSSTTTKPKGLGEGHARQEEAECQRIELALRHDADGHALLTFDGDVQSDAAASSAAFELGRGHVDAALLAQELPDLLRVLGNGGEAIVAEVGLRVLHPLLGLLQSGEGFAVAFDLTSLAQ